MAPHLRTERLGLLTNDVSGHDDCLVRKGSGPQGPPGGFNGPRLGGWVSARSERGWRFLEALLARAHASLWARRTRTSEAGMGVKRGGIRSQAFDASPTRCVLGLETILPRQKSWSVSKVTVTRVTGVTGVRGNYPPWAPTRVGLSPEARNTRNRRNSMATNTVDVLHCVN